MTPEEQAAGIRTVTHAAGYFEELKTTARELVEQVDAVERGYFKPTEEDAVRAVLVSYWQVRNALFELITSIRDNERLTEEERPRAFMIAFSAALVLIDAARFLREIVEPRPLVRQKLNEPAAQFGIPAGVYDSIQRSLLSARHGWHLYHAIQYCEQHRTELRGLAAGSPLQPLMEIIDRLWHRVEVSVTRFANVRLRTRADQLLRRLARTLLGKAIYGLQKLAGDLAANKYLKRGHQPLLPDDVAKLVRAELQPGDVMVVRKEYALTNYFLPGYWPHAALYLGAARDFQELGIVDDEHVRPRWPQLADATDTSPRVLESMKDGVFIRQLSSPFASDSIVVLRPRLAANDLAQALARCLAHEGKHYDFDFDFRRSDRLVCTEVVYRAYDGIGGMELPLTSRAGRPSLSGSDLISMGIDGRFFEPVTVYAPLLAEPIATGLDCVPLLEMGQSR